jgi:hypothetical protein
MVTREWLKDQIEILKKLETEALCRSREAEAKYIRAGEAFKIAESELDGIRGALAGLWIELTDCKNKEE